MECLTTEAFRGTVTFAENAPFGIDESDSERTAVLKFQSQWGTDPFLGIGVRIEVNRAFDPVQAGNGKTGAFDDALESAKAVPHLAERHFMGEEFSDTATFLD